MKAREAVYRKRKQQLLATCQRFQPLLNATSTLGNTINPETGTGQGKKYIKHGGKCGEFLAELSAFLL